METKELKACLNQQAEAVCRLLLPNGKRMGHEWRCGSLNGEPGQSLGIHLTGERAGAWADFQTGQSGDLLELWRLVKGLDFPTTLAEVRAYLGVAESSPRPSFHPLPQPVYQQPNLEQCLPTDRLPQAVLDYLTGERKLTAETLERFHIGACEGREAVEVVFPYQRDGQTISAKFLALTRADGKKRMRNTPGTQPSLFGWQAMAVNYQAPLILTEGEIDAMTMSQYGFNALSVPFGAGTGSKQAWIETEFDRLEPYQDIVLCLDMDEPGQSTAQEIANRLGVHRCRIAILPHKDANACLQAGVTASAMAEIIQQAKPLDPDELKPAVHFVEDTLRLFYPEDDTQAGLLMPWHQTHNTLRVRHGELSIWAGINGHGKSQLLGHLMLELIKQEERVCIASMEIRPGRLLYRLTRQAAAMAEPSPNYIRHIHESLAGKLWLFDVVGTAKTERILEVFTYAYRRYGVRQFVIDSLMKCGIAEDDYRGQKAFVEALCDFKNTYDVHIHLVAHCRKGESEYQPAGKLDVKGTGAIVDLADNAFNVWRNKAKEEAMAKPNPDPGTTNKPDAILHCHKQRNGEWEGKLPLWFDRPSMQFISSPSGEPYRYIGYSELIAQVA